MNSIKGRKLRLWLSLFVIMGSFTYLLLILVDISFAKYLSNSASGLSSESKSIINKRVQEEDIPQKKVTLENGYQPILYPYFVAADPDIKTLAMKHGVAPLAPQPETDIYFCNEGYGLVKYKTDRFGFRNPDSVWDQKVKLTLVGDSFVQGACVSYDDTLQGRLRKSGIESISLGTGANSPYHYSALIQSFLPCISPQFLGIVFYSNDNITEENRFHFNHYFNGDQENSYLSKDCSKLSDGLVSFYNDVSEIMLSKAESIDNLSLPGKTSFLKSLGRYFSLPTIRKLISRVSDTELPHSSKYAIDKAVSMCEINDCTPFIVYIPNSSYWNPDSRAVEYVAALKKYSGSKVSFIDLTDVLKPYGNQAYALKGGHLSPLGYELAAKEIEKVLQ
ncbi:MULTISPECIES: SGNH/GDSL hydrolase family protein [unclassified Oleiphilus]|uniref:SGNH/GDSL hydrolase family protein n=1 Tax=unclassified Oleiphilus TaxID=2631174 RepID=UPI0007C3CD27|nr:MULTISPECIES: SGNH/GDSL hydrolase family protein [unclassified Oleiphilus]KZZ37653.1 hypothetical protein A3757_10395 [Oleiphilus sp. HI0117]KZZ53432.1 hypothetical protein A3761_17035 [Oleiphilus sp. HI0123]